MFCIDGERIINNASCKRKINSVGYHRTSNSEVERSNSIEALIDIVVVVVIVVR